MTYKKLLTLLFLFVIQIVSYAQITQKEYDEYVDYVNIRYYFKYVESKIKPKSSSLAVAYIDDFNKYDKYFKTNLKGFKDIYRLYSTSDKTNYEVIKNHALKWDNSKALWIYVDSKKKSFSKDWSSEAIIDHLTTLSDTEIKVGNSKLEFKTFFNNFNSTLKKELKKMIQVKNVKPVYNSEVIGNSNNDEVIEVSEENNTLSRNRNVQTQTQRNNRQRDSGNEKTYSFFSFKKFFALALLLLTIFFIFKKRNQIVKLYNSNLKKDNFKKTVEEIDLQQKIKDLESENKKLLSIVNEMAELRTTNKRLQLRINDLEKKSDIAVTNDYINIQNTNIAVTNDYKDIQNTNIAVDKNKDDSRLSNILYANAIINDYFHSISDVPNEDTVYLIKLTNIDGRVGKFDIYQNSRPRVLKNPDFADGCEKQKLSLSPTSLQVEPGEVQKDDFGKWRVTKKAIVKFI